MSKYNHTNNLIHETSPYLLQHAHNPVDWEAWKQETLDKAKKENKLIIISIGYAACHWCHVMEHESFEDSTVAKLMNDNFISIKIDREERPDIDQVYMSAVQILTGRGGWPMNVVALPDGRPIWGGTYFTKKKWMGALEQLAELWQKDPNKLIEYAEGLTDKVKQSDIVIINNDEIIFKQNYLDNAIQKWENNFDYKHGGTNRAPKFPLPNNYQFLLNHITRSSNKNTEDFLNLSLKSMAFGGIYDHVGGGFSRYSTDVKWHIPHFEKMLYDNGQIVSLYSKAYIKDNNPLYKDVVFETLEFIERELMGIIGNFYSSLDADSDDGSGHIEEGAFYVWKKEELKSILIEDYGLFKEYYNVNSYGRWEHGNYVLIRDQSDEIFIKNNNITLEELKSKKSKWKELLFKERAKRSRPRLDDKTLTSWNALMLHGYVDAYRAFNEKHFLEIALKNAEFILSNQLKKDGGLFHNYKNEISNINGHLEDYACVIDAFIALYQITFDQKWLDTAKDLTDYTFLHFYDKTSGMFYFTSDEDQELISRKTETYDGVIPSSNSIMANNLFKLSHYYENRQYKEISQQMLNNVIANASKYASGFSNWLILYSNLISEFYEIAIIGENANEFRKELDRYYIPNKLIAGSRSINNLPLLRNRFSKGKTLIYICVDGTCKLPIDSVEKVIEQLNIDYFNK